MNTQPSLLSLVRQLRANRPVIEAAITEHENYRQAGFDTGYGHIYASELDRLTQAYRAACRTEDAIMQELYARFDGNYTNVMRAQDIAYRYA